MPSYTPSQPLIFKNIGHFLSGDVIRRPGEALDADSRALIIYGWSHGWTHAKVARVLNCHVSLVDKYWARVREGPSVVFELPLMEEAGKREWRCRLCNATRSGRVRCARHVLSHILPLEMARDCELELAQIL